MNEQYIGQGEIFSTWPGIKQKLEEYIRRCETYQKNKITQNKTK
jgi:hypothetical protein